MSVVKCGACGKYYNDGQYNDCPHCGASPSEVGSEFEVTEPIVDNTESITEETSLGKYAQQDEPAPAPIPGIDFDDDTTVALDNDDDDDEVTVALVSKSSGIDPVCGWLVCVEGPDKGRDFRIKTERNFIGRSTSMDIVISGAIMLVYFIITVETMNCIQPYHDGEDRGEAFVCNWSADTFYYDDYEGKYILYEEDSEDNWIERKMRKRYWRKRND